MLTTLGTAERKHVARTDTTGGSSRGTLMKAVL